MHMRDTTHKSDRRLQPPNFYLITISEVASKAQVVLHVTHDNWQTNCWCPQSWSRAKEARLDPMTRGSASFETGAFQFRIVTQSRGIPAVGLQACIKPTPQEQRYNVNVCALTEGISDSSYSSGCHVPTHRPQRGMMPSLSAASRGSSEKKGNFDQ